MISRPHHHEILALLPAERKALLDLLNGLDASGWSVATACPGWSVKDIAAHLVGDDLRVVAIERDGERHASIAARTWDELVRGLNASNEEWVSAWRRLSPRLLIELLAFSGPPLWQYFRGLDPNGLAGAVSWAGDDPAPHRLRVAREYTERWVHQQQIRDAVGVGGLREARWVGPLLDTFAYSLPVALQPIPSADGTVVKLIGAGEGGGQWSVARQNGRWSLTEGGSSPAATTVTVDVESLWRLYTKGIDAEAARSRATVEGDEALAAGLLSAVAIIA